MTMLEHKKTLITELQADSFHEALAMVADYSNLCADRGFPVVKFTQITHVQYGDFPGTYDIKVILESDPHNTKTTTKTTTHGLRKPRTLQP